VHARKGDLSNFDLPEHRIEVFSASLIGMKQMENEELLEEIEQSIKLVKGDFRQERILHLWRETLRVLYGISFDIATVNIHCSSGTYVRSIAHELGEQLGIPALAMHIVRTRAGKYKIKQSKK